MELNAGRSWRAWLGGLRAAGAGRACVLGVRGRRAWRAGRAGARRAAGARALASARARAAERQLGAGAGGRQGAGRARPGRLGWPWAVHLVHSAHFRSVLTRFFPESPNEHRSL